MRALTSPREARQVRATLIAILRSLKEIAHSEEYAADIRLENSVEKLEQAIIDFSPVSDLVGLHRSATPYIEQLADDLSQLTDSNEFAGIARHIQYRPLGSSNFETRSYLLVRKLLRPSVDEPFFIQQKISVLDAIVELKLWLRDEDLKNSQETKLSELDRLQHLLPPQKIAPVQFAIINGRLSLLKTLKGEPAEDPKTADAARSELLAEGERILKELERSNCDRRLIETVQYLQFQISEENNIIRVGLSNIRCQLMCSAFDEELPTAVASMLHAHTLSVEMFVAQFPDWSKFVENAAAVQLDANDIAKLRDATATLVQSLHDHADLVDPEVPKTVAKLNELLTNPGHSGKRAAFAILRSVENLISKIFAYGVELLDATASKTIDGVSSIASKAVIIGLLTLALGSAASISPVTSKITEMQWLKAAAELIQKQLQNIAEK
jgi:hypothetical protein